MREQKSPAASAGLFCLASRCITGDAHFIGCGAAFPPSSICKTLFDRNGKADVLRAQHHGQVDAHQLAVHVQERPAAVTGVDGGIRLQQPRAGIVALLILEGPVDAADDARGDGILEPQGIADGDDGLADHQGLHVGKPDSPEVPGRLNPDQGEVIEGVDLDDLRLRHGAVAKHGVDGRRPVHHVGIGDDEAGLVDDDAGAQALELHRPLGVVLAEVLFEEAVEPLAVLAPGGVLLEIDEALRADVHDGGGVVPDDPHDGRFAGAFDGRGAAGDGEEKACKHDPNETSFPVHGMPPCRDFLHYKPFLGRTQAHDPRTRNQ